MRSHTQLFIVLVLLLGARPSAGQSMRFLDVTDYAGLSTPGPGLGIAIHDHDGDGWDDVFVVVAGGPSTLFRNLRDGTFEDITEQVGIDVRGRFTAPAWADLDNDGSTDLYVGGYGSPARVLRGNPDGTFVDVSDSAGLELGDAVGSAALADYDNDGLVDLFVAVDRAPDRLYHNVSTAGAIAFEDVTTTWIAGPAHAVAMQATWFDYDHDGDQDLFVVHDGFDENRLYENRGFEGFVETASSRGIADIGAGNSMGIAWGDVDGDGWEDVYVSRMGLAGLYRNQGNGSFEVVEGAAGAERNGMAWGTVFSDLDNDRDLDLFVVNESGFDNTKTLLYENRSGTFADISVQADASLYVGAQGLAKADINRDGLVDLLFPGLDGQVRVLLGTTPNAGNWLSIRLEATQSNRSAIGVRVEIEVDGQTMTRSVSGGDSFCSQSSPTLHFGVGEAASVDAVRVYWSGGRVDERVNVISNTEVTITEGATSTGVFSVPDSPGVSSLYPNPTHGVFYADPSATTIEVYDVSGRLVLRAGPNPDGIYLGNKPAGIYFVRVKTDDTSTVHPIVLLAP